MADDRNQSKTVTLTAEELSFLRLMVSVGMSETGYGDSEDDDSRGNVVVKRLWAKLGKGPAEFPRGAE